MQQSALCAKPRLAVLPARPLTAARRGASAVCRYKVTLRTPEGESVLEVGKNTYILDAADEAGLDLPYSCRSGGCSQCGSKLVSGAAPDQSEQSFLDDNQLAQGYIMLCVAYPTGDCVIETNRESELM